MSEVTNAPADALAATNAKVDSLGDQLSAFIAAMSAAQITPNSVGDEDHGAPAAKSTAKGARASAARKVDPTAAREAAKAAAKAKNAERIAERKEALKVVRVESFALVGGKLTTVAAGSPVRKGTLATGARSSQWIDKKTDKVVTTVFDSARVTIRDAAGLPIVKNLTAAGIKAIAAHADDLLALCEAIDENYEEANAAE